MSRTWYLIPFANTIFYVGLLGSILTAIQIAHPFLVESTFERGHCQPRRIECTVASCQRPEMADEWARYPCMSLVVRFTSSTDNSTSLHAVLLPDMYAAASGTHCFVRFSEDSFSRCTSSLAMQGIMSVKLLEAFPDLPFPGYPSDLPLDFSARQSFRGQDVETFDCYYSSLYERAILHKTLNLLAAIITPSCIIMTLLGLLIHRRYNSTGYLGRLGFFIFDDFLFLLFSLPWQIISNLAYAAVVMVCCCIGRDVPWTLQDFRMGGGVCWLCVSYWGCCRRENSEEGEEEVVVEEGRVADTPPSYANFAKDNSAVSLPTYSELGQSHLPPSYGEVIQNITALDQTIDEDRPGDQISGVGSRDDITAL